MKTTLWIFIAFILLSSSCSLPKTTYFETKPFIEAYQEKVNKPITIRFGDAIEDSFYIRSAGLLKMEVLQFKKSLHTAAINTFNTTYNSVNFSDSMVKEGIYLNIVKVKPGWNRKSITNKSTYANKNSSSSTSIVEVQAEIRYQAVVYLNGEKVKILDNVVYSEKSTTKAKEIVSVLQDGIKVMCEDIYKNVITVK